jgi:serine/threonine protein kinase
MTMFSKPCIQFPLGDRLPQVDEWWKSVGRQDTSLPQIQGDVVINCGCSAYRCIQHLATGSSGAVYKAERYRAIDGKFTGENYVVKRISQTVLRENPEMRSDVNNQVRAGLGNEYVVQVIEEHDTPNDWNIIMELGAEPLHDTIVRNRYLSEAQARHYFRMMVKAVLTCHFNGVSHNDLKPKNFIVMPDGLVKLSDFGVAHAHNELPGVDPSDPHRNRRVGFKKGTPGYVAPEIMETTGPHDAYLADVWALGACLYDMLTGDYGNERNMEGAYRKSWAAMNLLSYEAKDLVLQLLAKDPRRRPLLLDVLDHPFMTASTAADHTSMAQDLSGTFGHPATTPVFYVPYGFAGDLHGMHGQCF